MDKNRCCYCSISVRWSRKKIHFLFFFSRRLGAKTRHGSMNLFWSFSLPCILCHLSVLFLKYLSFSFIFLYIQGVTLNSYLTSFSRCHLALWASYIFFVQSECNIPFISCVLSHRYRRDHGSTLDVKTPWNHAWWWSCISTHDHAHSHSSQRMTWTRKPPATSSLCLPVLFLHHKKRCERPAALLSFTRALSVQNDNCNNKDDQREQVHY